MTELNCAIATAQKLSNMWRTPHVVATVEKTGRQVIYTRDQWAALMSHDDYSECRFVTWHFCDRLQKQGNGMFPAFSKMK